MIKIKVPQVIHKIQAIDIDSTGTYIGIAEQGITTIWNLKEKKIRNSYKTRLDAIHFCKFSSDSKFFLFTNAPTIEIRSLVCDFNIQLPTPSEFSFSNNLIIQKTTCRCNAVIFLNLSTKQQRSIQREKLIGVTQNTKDYILLRNDGFFNNDVALDFWRIDILKLRRSIKLHNYFNSFIFQSVQGHSYLFAVQLERRVKPYRMIAIYNTFQNKLIAKVSLECFILQFQMSDKYLISLSNNKLFRLSLDTRQETEKLLEEGRIYSISNDCQHIIGVGKNDQIIIKI